MSVLRNPAIAVTAGAVLVGAIAAIGGSIGAPAFTARLREGADAAIAAAGAAGQVEAHFLSTWDWPSRHPRLEVTGGAMPLSLRAEVARAVAAAPGVGGIRWADGNALVESSDPPVQPRHCQDDVEALLRARTIRFEESSARIDAASRGLIDEVAQALRPCLGSIIAITGHTDSSGPEPGNIQLSTERANAVRQALMDRGIPDDGLRVRGVGSSQPVEGLDSTDPANRRIDFSVVATRPIHPTPVDTPAPR